MVYCLETIVRMHLDLCRLCKSGSWFLNLAQLVKHQASAREVAGSNPDRTNTQGLCLCNDICKWLDFLVFSDKDRINRRSRLTIPVHDYFVGR